MFWQWPNWAIHFNISHRRHRIELMVIHLSTEQRCPKWVLSIYFVFEFFHWKTRLIDKLANDTLLYFSLKISHWIVQGSFRFLSPNFRICYSRAIQKNISFWYIKIWEDIFLYWFRFIFDDMKYFVHYLYPSLLSSASFDLNWFNEIERQSVAYFDLLAVHSMAAKQDVN